MEEAEEEELPVEGLDEAGAEFADEGESAEEAPDEGAEEEEGESEDT
jgi:hypothetical protein